MTEHLALLLRSLGRTTHPGEKLNLIGLLTEGHGETVAAWPTTTGGTTLTLSTEFWTALTARKKALSDVFLTATETLALAKSLTPTTALATAA